MVKGDSGKWYEQAIFISKAGILEKDIPRDFVKEAEDIVNAYLYNNDSVPLCSAATAENAKKPQNSGLTIVLSLIILASCITIGIGLTSIFF